MGSVCLMSVPHLGLLTSGAAGCRCQETRTEGLLLAPPCRIADEDKAFKDTVLVREVDRQLNINDHILPCQACVSRILP